MKKKRSMMRKAAKLALTHLLLTKQERKDAKSARRVRKKLAKKKEKMRAGTLLGALGAMAKTALVTRELAPQQGIRANVKATISQQAVPKAKKQMRKRAVKPAVKMARAVMRLGMAAGTQMLLTVRSR